MPVFIPQPTGNGTKLGVKNSYPPHECTWWADERYHQLTGYYVPWAGDAHSWAMEAGLSGWQVTNMPVVPSIIVLQAGIQGADGTYGHVGVVERLNADGSVQTSDLNWGLTDAARGQVTNVTFQPGPGVSFVWVQGAEGATGTGDTNKGWFSIFDPSTWQQIPGAGQTVLTPGADIAATLVTLDTALEIRNPFDLTQWPNEQLGSISVPVVSGVTNLLEGQPIDSSAGNLPDPLSWVAQVSGNMWYNAVAIIVRSLFLFAGAAILIKVGGAFIDYGAIAETTQSGIQAWKLGLALA